jgi:hypothetical protein
VLENQVLRTKFDLREEAAKEKCGENYVHKGLKIPFASSEIISYGLVRVC